jgi:dihydrofolate reductase
MRKIILYIASSLDGKIADKTGEVGWLEEIPNPDKTDYGYKEFYDSIDTTLMGNRTWQQVKGFGIGNPYKGKTNYVITRDNSLTRDEHVQYVHGNVVDFVQKIKRETGKDIWCVGGGELIALLFNNNFIDEIRIFLMPIVLGEGILLTGILDNYVHLKLLDTKSYNSGVVEFNYEVMTLQ